jgi:acyl dehydratase
MSNTSPRSDAGIRLFKIGEEISRAVTFEKNAIKRFATLVGDMNPLHHDEEFAKSSRYGGLIASGTHTSSVMMGAIASFISARAPAVGLGFSVKMKKPIRADETARIVWRIVSIEYKASLGGDIVSFDGVLLNADGQTAVAATCANLIFPNKGQGGIP